MLTLIHMMCIIIYMQSTGNTTIAQLADDLDVTAESITVLVDQIADDTDLWDPATATITPTGVEIITDQVRS